MRSFPVYSIEKTDGLAELVGQTGRLTWASLAVASKDEANLPANKAPAGVKAKPSEYGYCPECGGDCETRERRLDGNDTCVNGHTYPSSTAVKKSCLSKGSLTDADLYPLTSILVSTGWNLNDDVFDPEEVWAARQTPVDKQLNIDHDCGKIVGHMTDCLPTQPDGLAIDCNLTNDEVPDEYDLTSRAVIYRLWDKDDLQKQADDLLAEIGDGKRAVSMECYFTNYDYALLSPDGEQKFVARNNSTAFLTKHLRSYGGTGIYQNQRVGRLLRNLTFSGKGLVLVPANPRSQIVEHGQAQQTATATTARPKAFRSSGDLVYRIHQQQTEEKNVAELDELKTKFAAVEADLKVKTSEANLAAGQVKTLTSELAGVVADLAKAEKDLAEANTKSEAAFLELKGALNVKTAELARITRIGLVGETLKWDATKSGKLTDTLKSLDDASFAEHLKGLAEELKAAIAPVIPAAVTPVTTPVAQATVTAANVLETVKVERTPTMVVAENRFVDVEKARAEIGSYFFGKK